MHYIFAYVLRLDGVYNVHPGRYTSLISKKYLILLRTQMLRIFLVLSVYTVFTSFFLTALEPKSVIGGVTNQQNPQRNQQKIPISPKFAFYNPYWLFLLDVVR